MTITLAKDLTLPLEMVGESTTIIAKKGAGKSNTAKVIVEGALDKGIQCVVLDPIGHWWGLRSLFPVPVIGGPAADVPLEPHAGKLLAEVAVDSGQSMVLDVSGLDSDGAMQRFAYELAEHLYRLKQAHPSPLLLVLEEADEFAPQDTRGTNVPRMVGAFARIVKRGRGRGIGVLAVTQRSASLSKNVLDQSDTLIVMRTVGPRDRKAIEEWVKHQDAAGMGDVLPSLPGLVTGEAWVWTPERELLKRVKVNKARSLDTSQSSIKGTNAKPKELKPIDLDKLGSRIAETAARVKADDPKELRKHIAALERQLSEKPIIEVMPEPVEVKVEVPVLTPEELEKLTHLVKAIEGLDEQAKFVVDGARELIAGIRARHDEPRPVPLHERLMASAATKAPVRPAPAPRAAPARPAAASNGDGSEGLPGPQQKILDAMAWYAELGVNEPTRVQIAMIAGYSHTSGGFNNLISKLTTSGYVEQLPGKAVAFTAEGREAARSEGLPTDNAGVQAAVMAKLDAPRQKILAVLIDAYPNALTRAEIAEMTGYSATSGGFNNLLSKLKTGALIEYGADRTCHALPVLFPMSSVYA